MTVGMSTEIDRDERAKGMSCEAREDKEVSVWYGIGRRVTG